MADSLKPSTKGVRSPLENGSPSDKIAHPPRFAEIGGLTRASKIGKRNPMTIRRPGGEK